MSRSKHTEMIASELQVGSHKRRGNLKAFGVGMKVIHY